MNRLRWLARMWHTLRYLKSVQLFGRVWFRLYRPRPDARPAPPMRAAGGLWRPCRRAASLMAPMRLQLLGVEHEIADAQDWNRADWPRLWLYNAHYFDDLVAEDASARGDWHRGLLARWLRDNPPVRGCGWEPYPTSLRIVNWCKWTLAGNTLDDAARHGLVMQVRHLRRRIEWHLLGNHLWANAKALVFAGCCFDGPEAARWRARGLEILQAQLREQVLADGGHFERSPMYHGIVLEDVLDLLQLDQRLPALLPDALRCALHDAVPRMLHWLRSMSHGDGEIAFFNDAALGISPNLAALVAYAATLGLETGAAANASSTLLEASGFARLQSGAAVLIADVGGVAPDYLPGHAHAGTLSFELSLGARRVLVNSGISTYAEGPERLHQRGTAAHNCVVVDAADSSEVWSAFRVARRARVLDRAFDAAVGLLAATHDGYRRLGGGVLHRREWQLDAHTLTITDHIDGRFERAEARFHFAPGCELEWSAEGGSGAIEASTWHPRFGESIASRVLVVRFHGARCVVRFQFG